MNPAKLIRHEDQRRMLGSLSDVFGDGTLYSLDYTCDYRLERMLELDVPDPLTLLGAITRLMDTEPVPASLLMGTGCSCFSCRDSRGHVLVGRNYDIKQEMTGLLVRSASQKGALPSFSLADMGWLGYRKGDLNDGKHDNSLCVAAPYLPVEGMNAEGLMIAVLQLMAPGARQDTGRKKTVTTLMMRQVLDRARNVEEAAELFASRDMVSAREGFDYHFFVADRSGKSAVLEYAGNELKVLDADRVTNFYLTDPDGELQVGRERYEVIDAVLNYRGGRLEKEEVLEVLKLVSQPSGCDTGRSNTRWSAVYDLTDLSAEVYTGHRYDRPCRVSLNGPR